MTISNASETNTTIPSEGDTLNVEGFEMTAHAIAVQTDERGHKVLRFTGRCTANPRNDSIRHTSYNGGRYGWRL